MGDAEERPRGPGWLRWWLPNVERGIVRVGAFVGALLALIAGVTLVVSWLERDDPEPVAEPLELKELQVARMSLGEYVADLRARGEEPGLTELRVPGLDEESSGAAPAGLVLAQAGTTPAGGAGTTAGDPGGGTTAGTTGTTGTTGTGTTQTGGETGGTAGGGVIETPPPPPGQCMVTTADGDCAYQALVFEALDTDLLLDDAAGAGVELAWTPEAEEAGLAVGSDPARVAGVRLEFEVVVNDPARRRSVLQWEVYDADTRERLDRSGRDVKLLIPEKAVESGVSDVFIPLREGHVGRTLAFGLRLYEEDRTSIIDSATTGEDQELPVEP